MYVLVLKHYVTASSTDCCPFHRVLYVISKTILSYKSKSFPKANSCLLNRSRLKVLACWPYLKMAEFIEPLLLKGSAIWYQKLLNWKPSIVLAWHHFLLIFFVPLLFKFSIFNSTISQMAKVSLALVSRPAEVLRVFCVFCLVHLSMDRHFW